jgi:hypothetical protein
MTKRFKEYDVELSQYKGTALFMIKQKGGSIAREDINEIKGWDEKTFGDYTIFPQDRVQFAVYHAEDHVEWQKFRVGLKGLTTKEKLYCLQWYTVHNEDNLHTDVRVHNYLGALIRGGQLDSELRIVR